MRNCSVLTACLAAAIALAASPREAAAEPQALGLVATAAPVPLQCQYGSCDVFLSAFCLEEARRSPYKRTVYRPAQGSEITLLVTTRDGRRLRLAGSDWLTFRTNYLYASVTASVDQARLSELGAAQAAVQVGPLAALVPLSLPGDDNPHGADELKRATGAYRRSAEAFFEGRGEHSGAAALTARLINALPRFGGMPAADRDKAIAGVMSSKDFAVAPPGARRAADAMVEACRDRMLTNRKITMRTCLEIEHGGVQLEINEDFWKSLAGV